MAAVLAVMGAFVYLRLADALMTSVDQTLHSQASDAIANVRAGRHELIDADIGGGTTLVEVVRPDGTPVRSSRPGLPLLALPAPAGQSRLSSLRLPTPRGHWRVLAV